MPAGGYRPGAGRKSNAQRLLDAQAAATSLATWFTPEYQQSKWQALLASPDEQVQLKAMIYLNDRLYGKPAQMTIVESVAAVEEMADEELDAEIAQFSTGRGAK